MTRYKKYNTPFGAFYIGYNRRAITEFTDTPAVYEDIDSELAMYAELELDRYFAGELRAFTVPIELNGTDFQRKVWNALRNIPYGEVRTYAQIAAAVGNPKACRAVGMANRKNPIAVIVPCHRVVASSGIGGYSLGLPMKRALLMLEKAVFTI